MVARAVRQPTFSHINNHSGGMELRKKYLDSKELPLRLVHMEPKKCPNPTNLNPYCNPAKDDSLYF